MPKQSKALQLRRARTLSLARPYKTQSRDLRKRWLHSPVWIPQSQPLDPLTREHILTMYIFRPAVPFFSVGESELTKGKVFPQTKMNLERELSKVDRWGQIHFTWATVFASTCDATYSPSYLFSSGACCFKLSSWEFSERVGEGLWLYNVQGPSK